MNYDRPPRWLLAGAFLCCAAFAAAGLYGPSAVRWAIQVLS